MNFNGWPVISSPVAVEIQAPDYSWIDRIIAWNPCNRELLPQPIEKPCAYFVRGKGYIMHPLIINFLQRLPAGEKFNTDLIRVAL